MSPLVEINSSAVRLFLGFTHRVLLSLTIKTVSFLANPTHCVGIYVWTLASKLVGRVAKLVFGECVV